MSPRELKGNEAWKECKILGGLFDTEKDINKRRKKLAIDAYKTPKKILNSEKNSIKIKIRTFNALVKSVFLYNSELWTLTKKLENIINTFQRRHERFLESNGKETSLTTNCTPEQNASPGPN